MATKPETVFRKRVRHDLENLKRMGLPIFFEAIQQKTIKGSTDFVLCLNSFFMGLELKDEDGKVAPIQEEKLNQIARAGGMAVVARPSNWKNVLQLIIRILEDQTCKNKKQKMELL